MNLSAIGEILFDIFPAFKKMGGAPFNFIYHVNKLIGKGNFISRIGNDAFGKEVISFLEQNSIPVNFIQVDTVYPTGTAFVSLDSAGIPEFKISEPAAYDFIEYSSGIRDLEQNRPHILYSGTLAQRMYTKMPSTYQTISSMLNSDYIYMLDVNLRQNFYSKEVLIKLLERADILKANLDEMVILESLLNGNIFDINTTPLKFQEIFNINLLCVTMGENGSLLFKNGKSHYYKSEVNNIKDTVGAGDAFSAILCIGYMKNFDISDINTIASEFAAEICQINGAIPDNDEIYFKYRNILNI